MPPPDYSGIYVNKRTTRIYVSRADATGRLYSIRRVPGPDSIVQWEQTDTLPGSVVGAKIERGVWMLTYPDALRVSDGL